MRRFKLVVEYDGQPFVGWARQPGFASVQGHLEEAIKALIGRYFEEDITLQVAGRTDAGVHALSQVAHIDIPDACDIKSDRLQGGLNFHVRDHGIAVLKVEEMQGDWHARFSALGRHYCYRVLNRRAPPGLMKGRIWHVVPDLDIDAMRAGAHHLIGTHDFTTFRHVNCQAKSPVKTLDYFEITAHGEEIWFSVGSRSFLHHQVRSMVGSLKLVGAGNWRPDQMKEALDARDRQALGMNAPPDGLYFLGVDYEEGDERRSIIVP